MAVISIISAVALPSFMRSYRGYQLSDAAYQVAGVLKFTHYEAVRLNVATATPLKAQVTQVAGTGTYIFTDSNNSGTVQQGEKQALFPGVVNLVPSTTPPNTGGLAAAVGVAAFTNISPTNGSVSFDQRGAVAAASGKRSLRWKHRASGFGLSSHRRASHGFDSGLVMR